MNVWGKMGENSRFVMNIGIHPTSRSFPPVAAKIARIAGGKKIEGPKRGRYLARKMFGHPPLA
jgi:hypothetical protein